jgi:hypothetical protein
MVEHDGHLRDNGRYHIGVVCADVYVDTLPTHVNTLKSRPGVVFLYAVDCFMGRPAAFCLTHCAGSAKPATEGPLCAAAKLVCATGSFRS